MNRTRNRLAVCAAVASAFASANASVKPAPLFQNNMVIQQRRPIPVWGVAAPGEQVTVVFRGVTRRAVADTGGCWRVVLPPQKAAKDQQASAMTIRGTDPTGGVSEVSITNVLVGEVWLCSGQSNMQFPLASAMNAKEEIARANYPWIRMFTVRNETAARPRRECAGQWAVCSPETASAFSAVGYFFARDIHTNLNVPVGMINASWGGSPVEPWTDLETLRATKAARTRVEAFEHALNLYEANREKFDREREEATRRQEEAVAKWNADLMANDLGTREGWQTGSEGSGDWKTTPMPMPDGAPALGGRIGFVWCRKSVAIPPEWKGRDLELRIGPVDEVDTTYFNGTAVGETTDVSKWQTPRKYTVPAALVTNDRALIAIRVMNQFGGIGIFGTEADYSLAPAAPREGEKPVSLAGEWSFAFGSQIDLQTKPNIPIPSAPGAAWDVSTMYNAMIAPLAPYAIQGALWYQGESNAGKPLEYLELFPALISSWRKTWGQGDFAFLFVQLANFMARQSLPVEPQSWADIRDSQFKTLSVPNTGMAVAIDIGDANDIHPRNKQEVGRRLALWALAKTYGRKHVVCSGPLFSGYKVLGDRIAVSFDHAKSGLTAKDGPLTGFAIAGEDKVFHRAEASIEGRTVVVSSSKVPKPVAVRYGWANNPVCNLYNNDGLPASPFRTDDWKPTEIAPGD